MPDSEAETHCDVLLIEDDPDHVQLIQAALEARPPVWKSTVISDGQQALDHVLADQRPQARFALPGLVLLDLKLPKVDGLDILKAIRSSPIWRGVPVVILSTSTRPIDIEACFAHGADSYVTKVISPEGLTARVRDEAARWASPGGGTRRH